MRPPACSSRRRTSRTATARWWRTWARSANVAVGNDASSPVAQSSGPPVACAAGRSMPIRTSSRCASATSSARSPEQRDRRAPGDQPAEVGRERALEAEVQRARRVAGRERRAVPQVDDPLPRLDAPPQLGRVGGLRGRQVGRAGPGGVRRGHVGVVRRPGAEAGEQLLDVGLLVLGQGGVRPLLLADRRGRGVGLRRGAERAEAVGREDRGARRGAARRAGARRRAGAGPARGCARPRAGRVGRSRRRAASRPRRRRRTRRPPPPRCRRGRRTGG